MSDKTKIIQYREAMEELAYVVALDVMRRGVANEILDAEGEQEETLIGEHIKKVITRFESIYDFYTSSSEAREAFVTMVRLARGGEQQDIILKRQNLYD